MTIKVLAELEIDQERGVIYVHSLKDGHTLLRIGHLPAPIPDPSKLGKMLDLIISCNDGKLIVSWGRNNGPI